MGSKFAVYALCRVGAEGYNCGYHFLPQLASMTESRKNHKGPGLAHLLEMPLPQVTGNVSGTNPSNPRRSVSCVKDVKSFSC